MNVDKLTGLSNKELSLWNMDRYLGPVLIVWKH